MGTNEYGNFTTKEGVKLNSSLLNNQGDERLNNLASVALHEATHSTGLDDAYAKIAPEMKMGNIGKEEIYPRIMETRNGLGKKPGENVSEEDLKGLGFEGMMEGQKMYPSYLQDLMNEYEPKQILEMLNTWALNTKKDKKDYA